MRVIKEKNPQANIVAVDYDSSASKVNQQNRIKLMLANARLMSAQQKAQDDQEPPVEQPLEEQQSHQNQKELVTASAGFAASSTEQCQDGQYAY